MVIYAVIALIALAGGTGIGYLLTESKVTEVQTEIGQLQKANSQLETDFKKTEAEITQLKTDLVKARNEKVQFDRDLTKAKMDLSRTKAVLQQVLGQQIKPSQTSLKKPAAPAAAIDQNRPSVTIAGTREYIVKNGDSLWVIATKELGSGTRYEEILKLNPHINKNTTLDIGMKLKIPAK